MTVAKPCSNRSHHRGGRHPKRRCGDSSPSTTRRSRRCCSTTPTASAPRSPRSTPGSVRLSGSKLSARTSTPEAVLVTVLKAALRSRTVGFPESGSDLGSAHHLSEDRPAQRGGSLSADPHTPLAPVVCLPPRREDQDATQVVGDGRWVVHRPIGFPSGLDVRHHDRPPDGRLDQAIPVMSSHGPGSLATQCPGLLCPPGVLPRVGATSRVASEGITPPSSLLRAHAPDQNPPPASDPSLCTRSLQVAVSPCWEMALPDVISATLA